MERKISNGCLIAIIIVVILLVMGSLYALLGM